ncbi:AAA family ATPase [Pseudoduganella ginsengisoli]|uniref:AAA family ATPase n=1 Tax=Pseudoduganella ginsengisoli TaxID=1462440 RepID=A0A6L6PYB7_9BURK|nr:AAA family ATPase [Pseudoduganella ginsengisoli]MTW02121.1 AAA family ATPase [Pseudoduganella ginsengisoli]
MTGIYLSRISLRDFRTFGNFDIDIPAAPGLTLLTGTNGLGKSNFFDAIEWGLTGKIRRFSEYVEKGKLKEDAYLTRTGALANSHKVMLEFSDGSQIERSAAYETPMQVIITQLAKKGRVAIHDLETYLALTHFLGQTSQQRFTSLGEQEQWKALKGPSGIERLESVRSGLRGRPTTNAFTRRLDDERTAIANVQKKIAVWLGLQSRIDRLQQAVRASGTLTEGEVQERTLVLEAKLFSLLKEPMPNIEGETLSQWLIRLGEIIEQSLHRIAERIGLLKGLEDSVDQFAVANVNAQVDHPVLVRLRKDAEIVRHTLRELIPESERADLNVASQSSALRSMEQDISLLEAVRTDLLRQQDISVQIVAAETDQTRISAILAERRAALATAEADVQSHTEMAVEVARSKSIAQQARSLVDSYARLNELDLRTAQAAEALAAARQAEQDAKVRLESVVPLRDQLDERIRRAKNDFEAAERRANAVSAAIATIASHINHDDQHCPVCRTTFEVGQLKLLANEAAQASNVALAGIANEIEALRTEEMIVRLRIGQLQAAIDALVPVERAWITSRDTALQARVALTVELGVDEKADLGSVVTMREQISLENLTKATAMQDERAASGAAAAERLPAIMTEVQSLLEHQTKVLAKLSELRSETAACTERIAARGMSGWSTENINMRLSEQRLSLEAARAQLHQFAEIAANVRSRSDVIRQSLILAEKSVAEAEQARNNAERTANQLQLRWTRNSLDGSPSREALDDALASLQGDVVSLNSLRTGLQELARENQDALLKIEIEKVASEMREVGGDEGFSDPSGYLAQLDQQEAAAKAALKLTEETRRAVQGFTESLKSHAEDYTAQVLAPLNGVICDFNEALLSTPGQSIQFKTAHRVDSTTLGMLLQRRHPTEFGSIQQEVLPPQVVLSEGQLAANGFSILCAASTAYRWSKWQALLLDDPLQHNDIIHTAAFIDVMRNLVEFQGYQLIMSSHDKAEGDFIARKFNAAGLPCSRINLISPSNRGVVFEGPEHNSAAQAIMRRSGSRVAVQ